MLRIVGVQKSDQVEREFLLLQNHGTLRVCLRGHVVLAERAIKEANLCQAAHIFSEEEHIPAGLYVLLSTGPGIAHWGRTKDGAHVYHAYAGQATPLWSRCEGPIHLLSPCHAYIERPEALSLR